MAGPRVGAYNRRRDFNSLVPSNIPPMASATGTPAPIEGAGAACNTHETDEQGSACAAWIPIADRKSVAANAFICVLHELPHHTSNVDDQNQSGNGDNYLFATQGDAGRRKVETLFHMGLAFLTGLPP